MEKQPSSDTHPNLLFIQLKLETLFSMPIIGPVHFPSIKNRPRACPFLQSTLTCASHQGLPSHIPSSSQALAASDCCAVLQLPSLPPEPQAAPNFSRQKCHPPPAMPHRPMCLNSSMRTGKPSLNSSVTIFQGTQYKNGDGGALECTEASITSCLE